MLNRIAPYGIALAGVINLLPVSGVLGASWLKSLYGFDIAGADLEILLRHRAILFGVVGLLLLASVFHRVLRPAAVLVGLGSMVSFIGVAVVVGGYGPAITKIIIADLIGIAALVPALVQAFSSFERTE
jgi:hypothetical protein